MVKGDTRANQIMGLTALHMLFLRQHNFLATALSAINPQWNDEILYQEARRIVIAVVQHLTYNEFLPVLLGRPTLDTYGLTPQTTGYSPSYDETVNPSITNEFSAAAFRMGHSLIQGAMKYGSRSINLTVDFINLVLLFSVLCKKMVLFVSN